MSITRLHEAAIVLADIDFAKDISDSRLQVGAGASFQMVLVWASRDSNNLVRIYGRSLPGSAVQSQLQ